MDIKKGLKGMAWIEYQMAKNKCDRLESELNDAKQTRDTAWAAYCSLCPTPEEFGCNNTIEEAFQNGVLEDGRLTFPPSNGDKIKAKY